jgi:hypothetical protein
MHRKLNSDVYDVEFLVPAAEEQLWRLRTGHINAAPLQITDGARYATETLLILSVEPHAHSKLRTVKARWYNRLDPSVDVPGCMVGWNRVLKAGNWVRRTKPYPTWPSEFENLREMACS